MSPWDYRKGVSYFLRTQADYQDVFRMSKFSKGKHGEWKPYLASLFGFPRNLIQRKYKIDDEIEEKKTFRKTYSQEVKADLTEYDRIKGMIEIKRREVDAAKKETDKFNFYQNDVDINADLVNRIEAEVARLNEELYEARYEAEKIRESIAAKMNFDLAKVRQLFDEAQVYLSRSLIKDYEDLVQFNQKLSEERNRRLSSRLDVLSATQGELKASLAQLNGQREQVLSVLQTRDTFAKFQTLQSSVVEHEVEIPRFQAELENLDAMSRIDREIRTLTQGAKRW